MADQGLAAVGVGVEDCRHLHEPLLVNITLRVLVALLVQVSMPFFVHEWFAFHGQAFCHRVGQFPAELSRLLIVPNLRVKNLFSCHRAYIVFKATVGLLLKR